MNRSIDGKLQRDESDAALLARWAAGCQVAGSELIERHFATVHRFFRSKVHSEPDLEDLVQQTLLGCVEARSRYRHDASFRVFLLGIARHQLYSYYGSQQRRRLSGGVTSLRDSRTSPTRRLVRNEEQRLLREALTRVPVAMQVVLDLAFGEGLSGPELADVLGVPLNTAYSRLGRAKRALLAAYKQELARGAGAAANGGASSEAVRSFRAELSAWSGARRLSSSAT
jgi:RNA polymerase sigma-70 factor (ECF subfamily)